MPDNPTTPEGAKSPGNAPLKHRNPIVKIVRAIAFTVIGLLLLVIAAVGIAVWILTPDRLTPLVNKYATEQLNATVEARRVKLTFWSSFPRLKLQVDSLVVTSHSLRGLDPEIMRSLPSGADSLMSLGSLRGSVDVLSLLAAKIHLYDVELHRPRLNIVQVDSLRSNYDIFPASDDTGDKTTRLPDITVNRFAILGGFPVRYTSLADSVHIEALLSTGNLQGKDSPVYMLNVDGDGLGQMASFTLPRIPFGLNGELQWKASNPGNLRVNSLKVSADDVVLTVDAAMEMLDSVAVNEFKIYGKDIPVANIINLIPENYRGDLANIETDLRTSISAEIRRAYRPATGRLPEVGFEIELPRGSFYWGHMRLNGLQTRVKGVVNPSDPDRSVIEINGLTAEGDAIDFTIDATVTTPVSDPMVNGRFNGSVDFSHLPKVLTDKLPARLSGRLSGNADFKLRQSHLNAKSFHRMRINGELNLNDFRAVMNNGEGTLFTRHANFKLGSGNTVTVNGMDVDSLLTASLTVDTIAASIPGLEFMGSGIKMGMGSKNVAASSDTTRINPLGASIRAKMLALRTDSDSMRLRLNDAFVRATLQRYNSDARAPLLKLNMEMGGMRMADRYNRFSLSDASANVTLHPKARPRMSKRFQAVYDSVAAAHPGLSSDSIMTLAARHRYRHKAVDNNAARTECIDFDIDNSLKSWLRLWQLEGDLKARRARVFTPYFPVRNTVSNLDMKFSTDSIALTNTVYRMGVSDFLINGSIKNITRALISKNGSPLQISLDVACDTLNFNDITRALMMGAAFSERISKGEASVNSSSDESARRSIESQIDSTARGPVLIPTNITANVSLRAANMKYGDIKFQRFTGEIEAVDGAVHLKRLGAYTPMGSFGMTAMYSAPRVDDIRFAAGMVIRRLDLKEFLGMLPEIDTIIPMLRSMEGIITAECALTTELDSLMDIRFHTLDMALKLSGDSLVLLDSETFKKISKWMMFKNKKRNMIDSMSVEMVVRNNQLQLYPFLVTLDRYRFGISGSNDGALNLDYHIAVLKSPIPFKFGVNIKGTPDHLKIRLGGAHFNENQVATSRNLTDTVRINLVREIQNFFRFGVKNGRNVKLTRREPLPTSSEFSVADTISHADSVFFIRQGIIPRPAGWIDPDSVKAVPVEKKKKFLGIF